MIKSALNPDMKQSDDESNSVFVVLIASKVRSIRMLRRWCFEYDINVLYMNLLFHLKYVYSGRLNCSGYKCYLSFPKFNQNLSKSKFPKYIKI